MGLDGLSDQFKNSLSYIEDENKPDFRELDLGTHQSGLTTTTSSSSNSSGSISGRVKPGHTRSRSDSYPLIYSGCGSVGSCVNSPALNSLPIGNICPKGRILKAENTNKSSKIESFGSRTGNYGIGSIIRGVGVDGAAANAVKDKTYSHLALTVKRGGGVGEVDAGASNTVKEKTYSHSRSLSIDSDELKRTGNENYKKGNIADHLKSDGFGSRTGNYSHGNIIRGGGEKTYSHDPEELKRIGNENYKKGNFGEALKFYDKAIGICAANAAYHCNRAAALMGLKRLTEAVKECVEAIQLDPSYFRAHQRLGTLLLSLGQVENARIHMCFQGHQPDRADLQKFQTVEKHMGKCTDARRVCDWWSALREADAAISSGADSSPHLFACRAEALLKLHRIDDAELSILNARKFESSTMGSESKIFGMLSEAYLFFVQSQIELAYGRFESALATIEKAGQIDPQSSEISVLLHNVRLILRARARGNDLFKSDRYTEACAAYGEGLRLNSSNSVLYCNRAACWYKLGQWEKSVDDCDQALRIQPNYTKALLRRAASNTKLERWVEAVRDYEVLRKELPYDNEVAESMLHAQAALKKLRGEDVPPHITH